MKIEIQIEVECSGFLSRAEKSNGFPGDVEKFKVMKGNVDITNQLSRDELSELMDAFFLEKSLQRNAEMSA